MGNYLCIKYDKNIRISRNCTKQNHKIQVENRKSQNNNQTYTFINNSSIFLEKEVSRGSTLHHITPSRNKDMDAMHRTYGVSLNDTLERYESKASKASLYNEFPKTPRKTPRAKNEHVEEENSRSSKLHFANSLITTPCNKYSSVNNVNNENDRSSIKNSAKIIRDKFKLNIIKSDEKNMHLGKIEEDQNFVKITNRIKYNQEQNTDSNYENNDLINQDMKKKSSAYYDSLSIDFDQNFAKKC